MKNYRRLSLVAVLAGCACLGLGLTPAEAAVSEVSSTTLAPVASTTTLTILDANGVTDLTNTWLPKPNEILTIRINTGSGLRAPTSLQIVESSSYPGACTNFGATTDTSPDFAPVAGRVDQVQSLDCGGRAVLSVEGHTFVIPQDTDLDGLPDLWEQQESATMTAAQCPNRLTCLDPFADLELLGANAFRGDGFRNFEEYRGFMVNNQPRRTKTTQKDLFLHLVNPTCSRAASTPTPSLPFPHNSLLGRGTEEAHVVFPTDGTPLFSNLTNLGGSGGGVAVHLLDYVAGGVNGNSDEWVDNFENFLSNVVVYRSGTDGSLSDRQVNVNTVADPRVNPQTPAPTPSAVQRGIRIIECLDNSVVSPIGYALFPPNIQVGDPNFETNSIIYTQRIWQDYERVLNTAGSTGGASLYKNCAITTETCVWYKTYVFGVNNKGAPTVTASSPAVKVNRNTIVSKYIQYIVAMETGHSIALIPEIQITQYGAHFAPGSGDNLDQRLLAKDTVKINGVRNQDGVVYYVPSAYSNKSNDCFKFKPGSEDPDASCQP